MTHLESSKDVAVSMKGCRTGLQRVSNAVQSIGSRLKTLKA